jgi:hypothetical protein
MYLMHSTWLKQEEFTIVVWLHIFSFDIPHDTFEARILDILEYLGNILRLQYSNDSETSLGKNWIIEAILYLL